MSSELFCEEIAHQAGFVVSVGNWITPDGDLIVSKNYDTDHWETLKKYLGNNVKHDNHLNVMNEQVSRGFIRLVFRHDVLFQVGNKNTKEIWYEYPNVITMREILKKIPDIEIHIFSTKFYIIGVSQDILKRNVGKLQIQQI